MSINSSFSVEPDVNNNGFIVKLDGLEIQKCIEGYYISHSGNNRVPEVSLFVGPIRTNNHYDSSRVELRMSEEEVKLLEKFGWKRPENG